ncbi:MAG: methyltransferase domain-containing protein [Gemmatimonadota bacterium]|nr:methyltransferase domain-containing protein [Gemmatimonadota bacterium]
MLHAHPDGTTLLEAPARPTSGIVMDMGWRYDLMVRVADTLLFRGGLRRLEDRTLELAALERGEHVLDVGCGTGELALRASRLVGEEGEVVAIDPGPRQIARARAKAAARGVVVDFGTGVIERLDFPPARFDVVLSTLMMHHLPDDVKRQGIAEVGRVLRPGGRVVIADFNRPERKGVGAGSLGAQDLPLLLWDAGFEAITSGPVPMPRVPGLHGASYVTGKRATWS